MKTTIGITCVGSGIGQSVVESLRLFKNDYKIIGFDMNPLVYGRILCDEFYLTKSNQDDGFINSLIDICVRENIEVLIPGLDDELLLLSRNKKYFENQNIAVFVSPENVIKLCLNKKKLSQDLISHFPEVVASYSRKEGERALKEGKIHFPLISKPIYGGGSQGIRIIQDLKDLRDISSDDMLQPFILTPSHDPDSLLLSRGVKEKRINQVAEVSVQYLVSKRGEVLGRIATRNKLKSGVPIEIIPVDIPLVWKSTQKIVYHLITQGAWGPLNLQGRIYSNYYHVFEINPRFTGITGLRAKMGFNEVEALLLDYLGASREKIRDILDYNPYKIGIRQISDTKFSRSKKEDIKEYIRRRQTGYSESRGKIVLVTGASGYIGQNLVHKIIKDSEIRRVIAVSRKKMKIESVFGSIQNKKLKLFSLDDCPLEKFNFGQVDTIIHLGGARPPEGNEEIGKSLEFTKNLVYFADLYQVPEFIYVSSQSVYGEKTDSVSWNENSVSAPNSSYAVMKLAGEMLVKGLKDRIPQSRIWIIRLSRIYGNGYGIRWHEMPHKLVRDFWDKKEMCILGGEQPFDLLHIKDVLSGICQIMKSNKDPEKMVYNLGCENSVTLIKLADCINRSAEKICIDPVPIRIKDGEDRSRFRMDSTRFYKEMNWKPQMQIETGMGELIRTAKRK